MTAPERLREAGEAIRSHLLPLWRRLHAADLRFHAIAALPDPLSTALCRHTTLFASHALAEAGWGDWQAVDGHLQLHGLSPVPDYARGTVAARHCWLAGDGPLWLDLTADQFGLAPVLIGPPSSAPFARHVALPGRPPLAGLRRTLRNWDGDPRGRWSAADLAARRDARAALLTELRRIGPPDPSPPAQRGVRIPRSESREGGITRGPCTDL